MRDARKKAGSWRRFVNLYRSIKVPWHLYVTSLFLGILAAQLTIWLAPFSAKVAQGQFEAADVVPMFLLISLLIVIVRAVQGVTDLYAGVKVERNLQTRVWGRLLRAPLRILDREHTSDLVARVTVDPLTASNALFALTAVWTSLYGFVGAVVAMTEANGTLTLIFLVMIPVTVLVFWLVGVTQYYSQNKLVHAWGALTGFFSEHLGAFKAMRLIGAHDHEIRVGNKQIDRMFRAGLIVVGITELQVLLGAVITNASLLVVFVGGAAFVRDGQMSQDDLVLFYSLSLVALPFLFEILTQYSLVKGTQGFTEQIGRVLDMPQEETSEGTLAPAQVRDLTFDDVSFRYDDDTEVLRNASFTIPGGQFTAIVGPNGSGKSTLLKLLQRVYEPSQGEIRAGEDSIARMSLGSWRESIATVEQESALLSGSVASNISFSDERATRDQVEAAARTAEAHEFIAAHPAGYSAEVGENGERLSGGQRQRVAIARALLADPQILLLDEASSALDRRTDALVDESVKAAMAGRTVVVVSHRLSTIAHADQIVVVSDGEIAAVGKHDYLLEHCTVYRELIASENARFPH